MANFSTYKNLELPLSTEKYNVQVFNRNSQVIDSELHRLDLKNQSQDDLLAAKEALNAESSRAQAAENALDSALSSHNTSALSHSDMRLLISDLTARLNALADSDDTTLDQLSEIVAYIKSNKSLIDGITTTKINVSDIIDNLTTTASNKPLSARQGNLLKSLIADLTAVVENKVDKISGKRLSTNDYTNAEKNKLAGIAAGAEVNVQADWNVSDTANDAFIKNKPTIPTKISQLTNDNGSITSETIRKIVTLSALPSDAASHPDTLYIVV